MAAIGHGYGSEWHLLRFLGRHREHFDRLALAGAGGGRIEWLDCPFQPQDEWLDAEWKGIDFIPDPVIREAWSKFWPQTGNVQNWDAVGRLDPGEKSELLLVEAKAYPDEGKSDCGAKREGGLPMIEAAFERTKQAFGAPRETDWLHGYYQY